MASQFELDVLDSLAELKAKSAVLETKVTLLIERDASKQRAIEELVADKNKGKGALWMLVTIGGLVGALLSNLKTLISLFTPTSGP